jgi:hypothetical protein
MKKQALTQRSYFKLYSPGDMGGMSALGLPGVSQHTGGGKLPAASFSKQFLRARTPKAAKQATFIALACVIFGSVLGCDNLFPPGDSTTLTSIKDNALYEDAVGALSNGAGQHMFTGKTGGGTTVRALVAFNVKSNVPVGATITAVKLHLNLSRFSSPSTRTLGLHRLLTDWGEGDADASGGEGGGAPASVGDATWLHTFYPDSWWSSPGGDFEAGSSASIEVEGLGAYKWGSTDQMVADVQRWLDDPSSNHGWMLMEEENKTDAKRFDTRENASEADRPRLTVTFIRSG